MLICTFFGHKDVLEDISKTLRSTIVDLIVSEKVKTFYVGNQGKYDYMVRSILYELSEEYNIEYYIVLAYIPNKNDYIIEGINNTILPHGIENVPKKFAIDWRNRWMLKQADFVVTYVKHSIGGAAKFKELAEKQNKKVINIFGESGETF